MNVAFLLLTCLSWLLTTCNVHAFPLYYNVNGSALLTSTYGGNITLRPDGSGAIVATSVIAAQGGVVLNNTLLSEQLISGLLAQVAKLQPPTCSAPGGDRLQYNSTSWVCVCLPGWTGANCSSPTSMAAPIPPPPLPSPPPASPTPSLQSGSLLINLGLGNDVYTVWQETDAAGTRWLLLLAGAGNDQTLCTNFSKNASAMLSATQNEAALYGGPTMASPLSPLAVHRLVYSASAFNAIRVTTVSYTNSTYGSVAGQHDFIFNFSGTNTVRDLMLTTSTPLSAGPSFSSWLSAFGSDRQGNPFFVRGGSVANSVLPSAWTSVAQDNVTVLSLTRSPTERVQLMSDWDLA